MTVRLKELAGVRIRFGYRRLTTLLRREGWAINAKRVYRIYRQEELAVRTRVRKKRAAAARPWRRRSERTNAGRWIS